MKVLITGSSTGFGKLIAETLIKEGHNVAATMRGVAGKNKASAKSLTQAGAKVVELDVANDMSAEKGVQDAVAALGGLDVVINNAGFGYLGLQEAFTIEDWKRTFDVNVFGVQRVNRAAIPHLRKQGSGLLISISSVAGRIVFPFFGAYTASKWAVEALSDGYRVELSRDGIESVVVEPGGFATEFFDKMQTPSDKARAVSLGEFANAPKEFFKNFGKSLEQRPDQKPQDVADAISKLIATPAGQRPFRTIVDKMGMADAVNPLNEQYEKAQEGVYGAFGMGPMLKTKKM